MEFAAIFLSFAKSAEKNFQALANIIRPADFTVANEGHDCCFDALFPENFKTM